VHQRTKAAFDRKGERVESGESHLPAIAWACGCQTIWCHFCWCVHVHGRGPGHREPHCGPQGPYARSGYVLEVVAHDDQVLPGHTHPSSAAPDEDAEASA
jgi:hypothetical protein